MKSTMFFVGMLIAGAAHAATPVAVPQTKIPLPRSFADALAEISSLPGPSAMQVERKGAARGAIAIVNAQTALPEADLENLARFLGARTQFDFAYVKTEPGVGCPSELKARTSAEFAVIVADDATTPTMLVAPEERWAAVNVAKLKVGLDGAKDGESTLRRRCVKEVVRAFSMLCGGATSQFPGNIMNVTSVKQLDATEGLLPVDLQNKYASYLKACGLQPREFVSYRKACQEGWAPAPTNSLQKAIWDKVHAAPATPMKIEFDPKQGR